MRHVVAVILALVLGPVAAAAAPLFQGLGDLPGGFTASYGYGISADGSVVVGFGSTAAGPEAFRWDAVNGMQGLGALAGDTVSQAWAISGDGTTVVGQSGNREAFVWTAGGGMQGLGDLAGGADASIATAVSWDGATVAGTGNSASGSEAFVWTAGGGMQGLGDLAGGSFSSRAWGISADGTTVVGSGRIVDEDDEAFVWDATDGMRGLGDLPGGDIGSSAVAASADGSIVIGSSESAPQPDGDEAFVWDAVNAMLGLGVFPSAASAITPDGSVIVGTARFGADDEPFIWDAANGMRELDQVLASYGLDVTGWSLVVSDVSDDGRAFTGWGIDPSGDAEAWYAVVPEPASGALLGLGLAGLGASRRARRG